MVKAVSDDNAIVGYTEILSWKVDIETYNRYYYLNMDNLEADGKLSKLGEKVFMPKIVNLAVAEDYRNIGLGSDMMMFCFDRCRELGYSQVVLQVEVDNLVARRYTPKILHL